MFLLFTLPSWCQMSWWTYRFTLTHNTELSIYRDISLYEKLSTPQNLITIFEAIFRWDTWRRLSTAPYPQSDASDGTEKLASLFLVLYSILCSQWSVSGTPWSATDDAAEATDVFCCFFTFKFLLLNQIHGVNNERSQSIQSVRHSKRQVRMWKRKKERKKSVSSA